MSAVGFEPLASVAKRAGVTTRCIRWRLKKLNKRLAKEHPDEPPILLPMNEPGTPRVRWMMDRSVAWRHARGYVSEDRDASWDRMRDAYDTLRFEVMRELGAIRSELDTIRGLIPVAR